MARGTRLPLMVPTGRALRRTGGDYVYQAVRQALAPGGSTNPFEQYGLDEDVIFSLGDGAVIGRIRMTIEARFRALEKADLAKLTQVEFRNVEGTGELEMNVSYTNLETGTAEEMTRPLNRSMGSV